MTRETLTIDDPVGVRIVDAFRGDAAYRTVGGISRDTGLSREAVTEYLHAHPELFRQGSLRLAGIPLWTLRGWRLVEGDPGRG